MRFLVTIHSVIDRITNSSTELFVTESDLTIKTIDSILKNLLEKWNKKNNVSYVFSNVFSPTEIYSEKKYLKERKMAEKLARHDLEYYTAKLKNADDSNILYYTQQLNQEKEAFNNDEFIFDKYNYSWGYEKRENIGKVLITGASDNSIPYDMWEKIISTFNADRFHLG